MSYDPCGEIAGRRVTEPEPLTPDKATSKILTAEQVAEIKRDCNRGVYLGHGSTIEFCDSHEALRLERDELAAGKEVALHHYGELHPSYEALRAALKDCVEALEYAQDRLTAKKAITAAREALGNG